MGGGVVQSVSNSKRFSSKNTIIVNLNGSEIIERTVSKFGTGAHVVVPKEYAGKKIKIILGSDNE